MVSRRSFLRALGGAAAVYSMPSVAHALRAAASGRKPNVILFYVDDMGRGMLSWYARKRAEIAAGTALPQEYALKFTTPNVDKLLDNGLAFTHAHGCMYCAPARASLLTGYNDCHGDRKYRISGSGQINGAMSGLDYTTCTAEDIEARLATKEAALNTTDVILDQDDPYLAQVFQRAGYKTAQVCKMDYGFSATRKQLRLHGWDAYYGYLDHTLCHGFFPPYLVKKEVGETEGKVVKLDGNTNNGGSKMAENESYSNRINRWNTAGRTGGYAPELCHAWALNWIEERKNANTPFFLFYTTNLPHGPTAIPASDVPYTGSGAAATTRWPRFHPEVTNMNSRVAFWKNTDGTVNNPPQKMDSWTDTTSATGTDTVAWDPSRNELTYLEAEYASMVKMLDQQVGDLMQKVKDLGIEDNTMIIFTSDNGHELYISQSTQARNNKGTKTDSEGNHDIFDGNNGQYGYKWNNWEGGIRVPLAVYWPGQIQHRIVTDVVANYDWAKTFASMLGVNADKKDGRDLNNLIFNGASLGDNSYVVVAGTGGPCLITNDGWKFRTNTEGTSAELYNLNNDYRERTNLSTQYPKRVRWMLNELSKACDVHIANGGSTIENDGNRANRFSVWVGGEAERYD